MALFTASTVGCGHLPGIKHGLAMMAAVVVVVVFLWILCRGWVLLLARMVCHNCIASKGCLGRIPDSGVQKLQ